MLYAHQITFRKTDGSALFENLSLQLPRSRHALVGINGVGKSVLGQVLAGELTAENGRVERPPRLGYFSQIDHADGTLAEALGIAPKLAALRAIENGSTEPAHFETLADDWDLPQRLANELAELSLPERPDTPLHQLSGGQRSRARLWGLFNAGPDYLILDEPSNHLDIPARQWLLQQLDGFNGGVLLISHDRELLATVSAIHELTEFGLQHYSGHYADYLQQRQLMLDAAEARVADAKKELTRIHRTQQLSRERAERRQRQGRQQRGSQAKILLDAQKERSESSQGQRKIMQQRQRVDANQELHEAQRVLSRNKPQQLHLHGDKTAASAVVILERVRLPFGCQIPIDAVIRAEEKWHLQGRNGSGKSTLLRALMAEVPCQGRLQVNGSLRYLDQHFSLLDEQKTALANLRRHQPAHSDSELRTQLAGIGLRGDAALQNVALLSGGQRLKLALLCCQGASLLLLDEPNNHLDLPSLELLEEAIRDFPGAVLLVSHDPLFVEHCGISHQLTLEPL